MRPRKRNNRKNLKLSLAKSYFSSYYKYRANTKPTQQTPRKRYFVIELSRDKKYTISCHEDRVCYTKAANKKKSRNAQNNGDHLDQLPNRQLEEILRYINVWHYKRIRDASQFFQQLHDDHLVHMFNQVVQAAKKNIPKGRSTIKLTILEAATIYYMQAGYAHSFCGCLLPMLRHCYEHPFRLDVVSLARFIIHFLQLVDEQVRMRSDYVGVVLYIMTFLRIFMLFPNKTIFFDEVEGDTFVFNFELSGCWQGVISSLDNCTSNQHKRSSFIMMLAKILLACQSGRTLNNKHEMLVDGENDIRTQSSTEASHTYFKLTIKGSPYISSLLRDVSKGAEYEFRWPVADVGANFALCLEISSDEAGKLGCNRKQVIDITNA